MTSVRIPEDIRHRIAIEAATVGRTWSAVAADRLRRDLSAYPPVEPPGVHPVTVSTR